MNDISEQGVQDFVPKEKSGVNEPDFKTKYIELLEKSLIDLKAEKDELKAINSKLAQVIREISEAKNLQEMQYIAQNEYQKFVLQNTKWSVKGDAYEIVNKRAFEQMEKVRPSNDVNRFDS